jgi:glycosyltransferase involved in cell wall biosynthesis
MTAPRVSPDEVSVVIAVRDGERYLAEALDSVLGQDVPPGEVVVVDDGSTDGTAGILARYGQAVRVLQQPPRGQFAATNRGVEMSRGVVLGFLDADDLWMPGALAARLDRLAGDDQPEAVFGRTVQFVSPELGAGSTSRFRFRPVAERARLFQTMLIRRSAFQRVGPLATAYRNGANIDWISRAQAGGLRIAYIDDVVAMRRLHGANMSATSSTQSDLLDVVRAHRRRGDPGTRSPEQP